MAQSRHNKPLRDRRKSRRRRSLDGDGSWRYLYGERRKADRRAEDRQADDVPLGQEFFNLGHDAGNNVRSAAELERIKALKAMLEASSNRQQQAASRRRPVLAAGVEINIANGPLAGKKGVIEDADYIESRVLVAIPGEAERAWIPFQHVGPGDG